MKTLTYKQLAFILDIEPVEALEKIIYVHCKVKDCARPERCDKVKGYLYSGSPYPSEMDVGLLAIHLNLPTLQQSVEDIKNNFLKRPATRKWILSDFPEKQLQTKEWNKVKIPPVLASMLNEKDLDTIKNEWRVRHRIKI